MILELADEKEMSQRQLPKKSNIKEGAQRPLNIASNKLVDNGKEFTVINEVAIFSQDSRGNINPF